MRKTTGETKNRDSNDVEKRAPIDKSGNEPRTSKPRSPHSNDDKLVAATVLPIPGLPRSRLDESTVIGGESFDTFAKQVLTGLDSAVSRVRAAHSARLTEQKQLGALLESPSLTRAFDIDTELRAEVAAVGQVFKQDQEQAHEAESAMAALQAMAGAELAALGKLLG